MKKRYIFSIIFTICMLFSLTSCKQKVNKLGKNIGKSLENASQVVTTVTITEKEVKVYEYVTTIVFTDKSNATISTEESTLNSSFVLETRTSNDNLTDVNKKDLFKLTINKKLCTDIKESKDLVSFNVSSENLVKIFNDQDMKASGSAHFEFVFVDKKIASMKCEYTTPSSRKVVITTSYQY